MHTYICMYLGLSHRSNILENPPMPLLPGDIQIRQRVGELQAAAVAAEVPHSQPAPVLLLHLHSKNGKKQLIR